MANQPHALASEQEARDVAEDARESEWQHPSFVKELFLGRFRPELVHPFPADDAAAMRDAEPFLAALKHFLETEYDADLVDRTGEIPEATCSACVNSAPSASRFPRSTADSASRKWPT